MVQESHEVEDHVAHDEVGHVALVGPDHGVEDLVAAAPNGVDGVIFLKKGTMVLFSGRYRGCSFSNTVLFKNTTFVYMKNKDHGNF